MKTVDQLLDYVAKTESGNNYSSFNPDDNGAGISFGAWQFNQKKGSLAKLLKRMHGADPKNFVAVLGASVAANFLSEDWIRSADLKPYAADFRNLGKLAQFQQVQRDLAREAYFEPAWKLAQRYNLNSERAAAMCFDVAVQYGIGGLERMLERAEAGTEMEFEPYIDVTEAQAYKVFLRFIAELADTHDYDKNRRHRILRDPALSDEPWSPEQPAPPRILRRGMSGPEVEELQRLLSDAGYAVTADGEFGKKTEGAVRWFQIAANLELDGIAGPAVWAALAEARAKKGNQS